MNTKIIKLDINKRFYETIRAKQGDTQSRFLLFNLLDGAIPINLTGRSVRVYGVKPDDKKIFNDLVINDEVKGYCTLELTNQILAIPGFVKLELVIYEGAKKLSSILFILEVIESLNSDDAVVSTNEFGALINGLNSLAEYDNYKNEIAGARGKEANLKSRLDKSDSLMADNVQQITNLNLDKADVIYVNEKLSHIVSGSPKGTYPTLNDLKVAKPSGDSGIYITLDNGHWNYWNDSTWISGGIYQSQGVNQDDIIKAMLVNNSSDRFIKYNKLKNGYEILTTENWITASCDSQLSVVNKKLRSTSDGSPAFVGQIEMNIPTNHKLYFRVELRGNKAGVVNIGIGGDNNFSAIDTTGKVDLNISTVCKEYSFIFTNTTIGKGIRVKGTSFSAMSDYIEIDKFILVDLTEIFGAGNEPSKEYMDCYLFAYNANILDLNDLLANKVINTVQQPQIVNGQVNSIRIISKHSDLIREDSITLDSDYITECRSLKNGLTKTFKTNLLTLVTEVY